MSTAVTPEQYAQIIAALKKEIANPNVSAELDRGVVLGELRWISVAQVPLGSLGDGAMIDFRHSPSCGNGGCPMWLFVRGPQGYRNVIRAGGWGFSLVPSGGSVPDIAFYWQMGAGETDVAQYHFAGGKFGSVPAHPEKCGGEEDTQGVCAGRSSQDWTWSITPAEYDSLRQEVQATSKPSAVSKKSFSTDAHAIDFRLVNDKFARVLGVGRCDPESACAIAVFECQEIYTQLTARSSGDPETQLTRCESWPMLQDAGGWGIAALDESAADPFSPQLSFVLARSLSANEVQLTRYRVAVPTAGPHPGYTLVPDSCRVANLVAGNRPAQWCSAEALKNPRPCGDTANEVQPGRKQ